MCPNINNTYSKEITCLLLYFATKVSLYQRTLYGCSLSKTKLVHPFPSWKSVSFLWRFEEHSWHSLFKSQIWNDKHSQSSKHFAKH